MSAQHCEEPGCTGEIEDGYCNVCGTPRAERRTGASRRQPVRIGIRRRLRHEHLDASCRARRSARRAPA